MKAGVINIGDEVLIGHTINTNLSLIARMLSGYGISVEEQISVRDLEGAIIQAFDHMRSNYNYIFISGGLGPTEDDLTARTIGKALNRDMVLDQDILDQIKSYFEDMNRQMSPNNESQAYFPQGAQIIKNDYGTASGFYIEDGQKTYVVLPGPPREVENILAKYLKSLGKREVLEIVTVNTSAIGESSLEDRLRRLALGDKIRVNTYFGPYGVDIKLIGSKEERGEIDQALALIGEEFEENIYGINSDSLPKSLMELLNSRGRSLALAESCTGGRMASNYTENPGASLSLKVSLVTYTEEAKIKELGVRRSTLDQYTAVSPQTAREMVLGLAQKYQADYYAISTGYASPPEDQSLAGLVYIGLYDRGLDQLEIRENRFRGSRKQIIQRATNQAFFEIYKMEKRRS